jgi:hypothetical protein
MLNDCIMLDRERIIDLVLSGVGHEATSNSMRQGNELGLTAGGEEGC